MAIEQDVNAAGPTPAEVGHALEAVLASETFRGSAKLSAFLRFVVESTLRGEQDRIKGYTIGVEALGRPENFDPQTDPIVRVEATRLRRALERYNATEGAGDSVVIELSRGSYVPQIRRREPPRPEAPNQNQPRAAPSPGRSRRVQAAIAIAVLALAGTGALVVVNTGPTPPAVSARPSDEISLDGPLRPGNGMPTLRIAPISIVAPAPAPGGIRPQVAQARPMTERLRTALARFETVNVVDEVADDAGRPTSGADYELIGSGEIKESGALAVRFRLFDVPAATTIWSRDFELPAMNDYSPIEEKIATQLAQTLAPPFGVIRSRERLAQLAGRARDPRQQCILEASESFRSFEPAQHRRARACLESLTARDPGFAAGFSYLGSIYSREYQYALAAGEGDLLDRALRAAQRGVELNPESARAYQMLATVLFTRRDPVASFAASEKAMALNGLDTTIVSDYGGRLIMTGELKRGMDMLSRAADTGSIRPSWYSFYLFLGHYLANDTPEAARQAGLIAADAYPLAPLARTLAAIAAGRPVEARAAFEQLAAARPAWRTHARTEILRLFPASLTAERVLRDLASAHLVAPE